MKRKVPFKGEVKYHGRSNRLTVSGKPSDFITLILILIGIGAMFSIKSSNQ